MFAIRHACLGLAFVVLASSTAVARQPAKPAPLKISFQGVEYIHRSTLGDRSDFTPAEQPDLKKFRDRLTIVVRDNVTGSDQLGTIANNLVGTVSDVGEVVRTDSMPNAATHETEHFIAAKLEAPEFTQAAFARIALVEGKGMAIVYTHRTYGEHSFDSSTGWMDRNGEATEKALMSWQGMPKLAQLRALPKSK